MLAITPRRKGRRIDLRTERERLDFKHGLCTKDRQLLNSFYIIFRGLKVQTKKKFISGEMLLCCQEQPTKYQFERRYYWKQPRHLNQARNKMDIDITHHGTSFVFNSFFKRNITRKCALLGSDSFWLEPAVSDCAWVRLQAVQARIMTDPGIRGLPVILIQISHSQAHWAMGATQVDSGL